MSLFSLSNTSRWKMRIKSVTQWSGRVKSGGLDVMTVRGLGQEPAAITISSKGYTILTYVTCSVHFWTYICHQNSFHSNSFSSRVMRMSWVSQYFPCYTMLCCHTFTFVFNISNLQDQLPNSNGRGDGPLDHTCLHSFYHIPPWQGNS